QAAEALLKTLEEPNPQVVLVLTGVDIQSIPETIQSRCRCAVMTFVATEEIRDELLKRDVDSETAERLAALSYGAVGWAIDASQDDAMAARRSVLRNDLVKWSGASLKERLAVAESLPGDSRQSDKARVAVLEELEILMTWWRDILLATTGQSDLIVNTAFRVEIEDAAARERPESALAVIRSVAVAATRIWENVDPRLTLEALAVAL
ncbi:MAG TPA: hypothetical protein VG815_03240, partial [Chloroflexota bacterium]|nr:hypothetical protein [Chloroflexota bacterium]